MTIIAYKEIYVYIYACSNFITLDTRTGVWYLTSDTTIYIYTHLIEGIKIWKRWTENGVEVTK